MFATRREIIGIDLGSGWAKAVVLRLQGSGEAPLVREYAMAPAEPGESRAALEHTLRRLFRKLRTRSRDCAVTCWPAGAKLRLFDRDTPEAARAINRMSPEELDQLFHEKLAGHVAVCGRVESCAQGAPSATCIAEAVPKETIADLEAVLRKLGRRLRVLQLAPIALLNAFTSSCLDVAREQPFLVTDFGRERALIVAGYGGLVRAIRVVDFPWETVRAQGATAAADSAISEQGAKAMQTLLKELVDVCDYLDAQDQHARLSRMHVSGALSSNAEVMRSLGQALDVECAPWNPLRSTVAADRALDDFHLLENLPRLPLAAGVALQYAA
jgi:Tfp pilus assembly PilM family ATPase